MPKIFGGGADATKLPLAGGTMTGAVSFSGSISSAGSSVRNIHGGGNANDWAMNCPTGGSHLFTVNGVEQFRIAHNAVGTLTYGYALLGFNSGGSNYALRLGGGVDYGVNSASAGAEYHTASSAYPSANIQSAPLITRAASTAIALCPVATGDVAKVQIFDDTVASAGAIVP